MSTAPTQAPAGHEDILVAGGDDGVLTVTLNRPAQRNAMTAVMEAAYRDALRAAERDPSIRAVVVTGAGNAFCAGADFSALDDLSQGAATSGDVVFDTGRVEEGSAYPLTFRKPLIAAINGACVGLGFSHALFCDVRFATPDAKISSTFARRGLIAEYGSAWLLPQIVGRANALDLLLSGRTILGDEALRLGLVQQVHPADKLLAAAQAYARDIAQNCSPTSIAVMKGQVNRDSALGLEPAVDDAMHLMVESFGRPDLAEGVTAHMQRRAPAFQPWTPST